MEATYGPGIQFFEVFECLIISNAFPASIKIIHFLSLCINEAYRID